MENFESDQTATKSELTLISTNEQHFPEFYLGRAQTFGTDKLGFLALLTQED